MQYMEFVKKNIGGIVLGGHIQALGITRILGRLGIPIIIVDTVPTVQYLYKYEPAVAVCSVMDLHDLFLFHAPFRFQKTGNQHCQ